MNNIALKINGKVVDIDNNTSDFFRMNKTFITDEFNIGGEFSSTFTIPSTSVNLVILNTTRNHQSRKFRDKSHSFSINVGGLPLTEGMVTVDSISKGRIVLKLYGESTEWISKLNSLKLNEIGYVNNKPTWFGGSKSGIIYRGSVTYNQLNDLDYTQTDYVLPTVFRYKTPITDYKAFTKEDIFGSRDSNNSILMSGKSFPDSMPVKYAYLGSQPGLTHEDFPPALYYRNVIDKVFESVGVVYESPLNNETWFNTLIMTYSGNGYQYNWKTLAYLKLQSTFAREYSVEMITTGSSNDTFFSYFNTPSPSSISLPDANVYTYTSLLNEGLVNENYIMLNAIDSTVSEDISLRVDDINNFNKRGVDESIGDYVVPADGRYKITYSYGSAVALEIQGSIGNYNDYINIGNGNSLFSYANQYHCIVRKSETNEYTINTNPFDMIGKMMNGEPIQYRNFPSDVIAYFCPRYYRLNGNNAGDIFAAGSPLTNWQETVTPIYNYDMLIAGDSFGSSAVFSIEVDLRKNERIQFVCVSAVNSAKSLSSITRAWYQVVLQSNGVNIDGNNPTIEYVCGYEDISLADNLPSTSAKEFISDYMKRFNLGYTFANNKLQFYRNDSIYNTPNFLEIDSYVDFDSIVYSPLDIPKYVNVGYENDTNDYLLSPSIGGCKLSSNEVSWYGINRSTHNHLGAMSTYNNGTFFSSTMFAQANGNTLDLVDLNDPLKIATEVRLQDPDRTLPNTDFLWYIDINAHRLGNGIRYRFPVMMTKDNYDATTFSGLTYDYTQKPRLLQHLGTSKDTYDTRVGRNTNFCFLMESPSIDNIFNTKFWVRPTFSSFDAELPRFASYIDNVLINTDVVTLRYDESDNAFKTLYDTYFTNFIQNDTNGEILECDVLLPIAIYKNIRATTVIKLMQDNFRILELRDYDLEGNVMAKLKLLKI